MGGGGGGGGLFWGFLKLIYGYFTILQSSHIEPRVSLDASPSKRPIYSIEYNHKRYDFYRYQILV